MRQSQFHPPSSHCQSESLASKLLLPTPAPGDFGVRVSMIFRIVVLLLLLLLLLPARRFGVCCCCCRCCSVCLVRLHKIPHYFLVVALLDPCHSGPYITLYGLILNSRWLWSIVPTLAQFFRSHCTWPSSSFAGPFCKSLAHAGDTRRSSSFAGRLSPLRDFLNSGFTGFQYSAAACFNASRDTKSTCAPVGFFDCPRMYAVSFSVLRSRVPKICS